MPKEKDGMDEEINVNWVVETNERLIAKETLSKIKGLRGNTIKDENFYFKNNGSGIFITANVGPNSNSVGFFFFASIT